MTKVDTLIALYFISKFDDPLYKVTLPALLRDLKGYTGRRQKVGHK